MDFDVGDLVVYGSHGAGRIEDRTAKTLVVSLGDGLTVTLPQELASASLRPLVTELGMARVRTTLRADGHTDGDAWLKRSKATREKVNVGDTIGLAEVVRDSAHRDGISSPAGGPRLSAGERELYLKARRLLALEISLARGVAPSEADDWIARQLSFAHP